MLCHQHQTSGMVATKPEVGGGASMNIKSLEPTPVTKARFVWPISGAAQLKR
jgi:hypothetical protein